MSWVDEIESRAKAQFSLGYRFTHYPADVEMLINVVRSVESLLKEGKMAEALELISKGVNK